MKIVDSDFQENEVIFLFFFFENYWFFQKCDMEFLCAECMEKTRENEHFHEKIMELL